MLLYLSFALEGAVKILLRCLLGLLDKPMQKDHLTVAHAKDHPSDSVTVEVAADLPGAIAKGSAVRMAKRLTKLDFLDVLSDPKPFSSR